jgi:hypothetical protein
VIQFEHKLQWTSFESIGMINDRDVLNTIFPSLLDMIATTKLFSGTIATRKEIQWGN